MTLHRLNFRIHKFTALPLYAAIWALLIMAFAVPAPSFAQSNPAAAAAAEGLSLSSIERARQSASERTDLDETQRAAIKASYDAAENDIKNGQNHNADVERLEAFILNGPKRTEELRAQITALENLPPVDMDDEAETMTAEKLVNTQQTLIAKEAEQRALRGQLTDYRTELETLQSRRIAAPKEQAESLKKINDLSEQIATRSDSANGPVEAAKTTALKARLYYRRAQAAALEVEIASFAERQKFVIARTDLAQLELARVSEDVTALQRLTGQQRTVDASQIVTQAKTALEALQSPPIASAALHPLVPIYAQENVELSQQLLTIARGASNLPQRQAQKRSQIDILDADLKTAQSLISLGNVSRQSATTLRQLRNDNVSTNRVKSEIGALNEDIAVATQSRLLAQNRIRQLGLGEAGVMDYAATWQEDNPAEPPLTAQDISLLTKLHKDRRLILTEITNSSRDKIEDLTQLKSTLDLILARTQSLHNLLDTNLLWLPSIAAIDISWPAKVVKGAAAVFSPRHFRLTVVSLLDSIKRNLVLVIIFLVAAGGCFALRERLWDDIRQRAAMVGRVQKDSYLHTPAVIVACIMIALPLPIVFFLIGLLFELAPTNEPFVSDLSGTAYYLAIFMAFFLTWRAWDGDHSLFDKHFKSNQALRLTINQQLRWFIPVAATSTALIQLTVESKDPNIFEGFSLAAFLVTTLALAVFSYNILWKRRKSNTLTEGQTKGVSRYWTIMAAVMVGVPICCALFASLGYYETTSELLFRLFISGWLLVATYVVYGATRRTVVISKRRIALKQAIERRDKAVKARQEQKAAEDRGEDAALPPPAVDYKEIDIETVSRQTEKLLNAFMLVLFAVLMWTIWSDLLPALSFFNNVELGHYMVDTIDPETNLPVTVERAITLWNVMQALVIFCLTVMAARNLPGFLEIFALNRLGFDAGTRYAIVTILGYIIFGIGLFMGLDRLGLQWSQLKWIVTGLSVGIGLGLQKIIANFVSGLIILFERPVRLSDYVTIGEQSGTVTRIQIRATTLVDLDNREIIIPNEELISQRVTNWTLSNSITRLVVNVGIAYGSDTDKAKDIVMEVLRSNKLVLETPPPQFIFSGFGDSSLDFEVRAFLKSFEDRVPTRHALHTEINKAFEKAGISIPFPQRDLHMIAPKQ